MNKNLRMKGLTKFIVGVVGAANVGFGVYCLSKAGVGLTFSGMMFSLEAQNELF